MNINQLTAKKAKIEEKLRKAIKLGKRWEFEYLVYESMKIESQIEKLESKVEKEVVDIASLLKEKEQAHDRLGEINNTIQRISSREFTESQEEEFDAAIDTEKVEDEDGHMTWPSYILKENWYSYRYEMAKYFNQFLPKLEAEQNQLLEKLQDLTRTLWDAGYSY